MFRRKVGELRCVQMETHSSALGIQTARSYGECLMVVSAAMPTSVRWGKCGLLRWLSGKESVCQCRRHGFDT